MPIKQTIITEDGHGFNGLQTLLRAVRTPKKELLDHPREVKNGTTGRCPAAEM